MSPGTCAVKTGISHPRSSAHLIETMPEFLFVSPEDDLQAVLDAAPENAVIHLAAGEYRQKCLIRTPGLSLMGAGAEKTRLVWGDYARKRDFLGAEYNTFRTYTLAVCADRVTMKHLSVANDALHPEIKGQEVALSVLGTDFLMEDCILSSTQDTLFAGPLPSDLIGRYEGFLLDDLRRAGHMTQHYINSRIEGTVDFIFGCADALFDHCEIRSVYDARNVGYVAAPAHEAFQTEGFLFRDCRFTCDPGVMGGSIYLARPWRDFGMARFEHCTYGGHIAPLGFDKWNDTNRDRTARFYETPAVPGRVGWINRTE